MGIVSPEQNTLAMHPVDNKLYTVILLVDVSRPAPEDVC